MYLYRIEVALVVFCRALIESLSGNTGTTANNDDGDDEDVSERIARRRKAREERLAKL